MNKEEFDINQELEQMRQDYAALKERFDKQQIINEQLIQNAMKKDVRRLFLSKKSIPVTIALFIIAVILCYVQGFAWWVPLSLIVYGLLTIPGVFWVYKGIREEDIYNGDILSTTESGDGNLRSFLSFRDSGDLLYDLDEYQRRTDVEKGHYHCSFMRGYIGAGVLFCQTAVKRLRRYHRAPQNERRIRWKILSSERLTAWARCC